MIHQNRWKLVPCIGGKILATDLHQDQTGTFNTDQLCRLREEAYLDHKDMVAIVLYQQEGPGTYMEAAHTDLEVVQVVHLHRKEIIVDASSHQDMVVVHPDLEVVQIDIEVVQVVHVETMLLLLTEDKEEV